MHWSGLSELYGVLRLTASGDLALVSQIVTEDFFDGEWFFHSSFSLLCPLSHSSQRCERFVFVKEGLSLQSEKRTLVEHAVA